MLTVIILAVILAVIITVNRSLKNFTNSKLIILKTKKGSISNRNAAFSIILKLYLSNNHTIHK